MYLDRESRIKVISDTYGNSQWDKLLEEVKELKSAVDDLEVSLNVDSMEHLLPDAKYKVVEEFADCYIVFMSILKQKDSGVISDLFESLIDYKCSRQVYRIANNAPKAGA